jgi:hypothetical protein
VHRLIHLLLLYLKYCVIVLAACIVLSAALGLWIGLRAWLRRLQGEL